MGVAVKIDFKTFLQTVDLVISGTEDEAFPVLMRGPHGIGKSWIVYQIAENAKKYGMQTIQVKSGDDVPSAGTLIERRASQMLEGDLIGLPILADGETEWYPPDWFRFACENPVILFFDEIDRADMQICQALFELTDSRKLNGHALHPGTRIFAAVNSGLHDQAKHYLVSDMGPAEQSRWWVCDLDPTVDDWLTWAKGEVVEEVWYYIFENKDSQNSILEHKSDFEPNIIYPSRRSWHRLSQCLQKVKDRGEDLKEIDDNVFIALCNGFIGEIAYDFAKFVRNFDRRVRVEDVVDHGKFNLVEGWDLMEHTSFVSKFEGTGLFNKPLSDKQIGNIAEYIRLVFFKFPELATKFVSTIFRRIYDLETYKSDSLRKANCLRILGYKTMSGEEISDILGNAVKADAELIEKARQVDIEPDEEEKEGIEGTL